MVKQLNRHRLTDSVPEWEKKYVELKVNKPRIPLPIRLLDMADSLIDKYTRPHELQTVTEILKCAYLLFDSERLGAQVVVIGCGPKPDMIRDLVANGLIVVGVDPVGDAIRNAREYLQGVAEVVQGTAEHISIESHTQALVIMENVLEHVDSVSLCLSEAYRLLKPGGVLFVRTTNRYRFSFTGTNWEFKKRFFNWFPRIVKESYVFDQLHYRPELAHYSPRPAVHWFNFPDLCDYGREAGFARFYSPYDLLYLTEPKDISAWRFRLRHWYHRNPWWRALAISQMNGDIFMWKRADFSL